MRRKKGYFSISAVAQMFSVHQQTIRLYEKEGLISPKRSEGNTRIFSEEDVDRLEEIIYLTHEVGINLAGVDMILKLQSKIKGLQAQVNTLFSDSQRELTAETEQFKHNVQQHIQRLAQIKQGIPSETLPQLPYKGRSTRNKALPKSPIPQETPHDQK